MKGAFTKARMAAAITMLGMLALAYLPVEAAYTHMFGDRATARVAECHEKKTDPSKFGGGTTTSCTGTWVTSAGERGSGRIKRVSPGDVDRTVQIRIGPHGAEAGSPLSDPVVVVLGGLCVLLLVTVLATVVWALRTAQRVTRGARPVR